MNPVNTMNPMNTLDGVRSARLTAESGCSDGTGSVGRELETADFALSARFSMDRKDGAARAQGLSAFRTATREGSWWWVLMVAFLALSACGSPVIVEECGPENCRGCCAGNECLEGDSLLSCGIDGLACVTCSTSERCSRGNCVERVAQCNPHNCEGCCAGTECLTGDSQSACGAAGRACRSCDEGLECREGVCSEPIKPPCDSTSCPMGCCLDGECVEGNSDDACGLGGASCGVCEADEICKNQRCYAEENEECAQSCSGCCLQGQCFEGGEDEACGGAGSTCRSCAIGELCEANSGVCVADTRPCGPETCSGCCLNGECVEGTVLAACGSQGEVCNSCGAGQRCLDGGCSFNLPSCGPWNCSGCCSDGVCVDNQNAESCGLDGLDCAACDPKLGELCEQGQCVPPPEPCSGDNCSGCCLEGRCVEGNFASACGHAGVTCAQCSNGQACVNGSCEPFDGIASCSPFNCNGCCTAAGGCAEGSTLNNCGASGSLCVSCSAGQVCRDGNCVVAMSGCGPENCAGCCDNGVCRTGTRSAECGSSGVACRSCLPGQLCIAQACSGEAEECGPDNCEGCCRDGLCLSGASLNACGASGASCASCDEGEACKSGSCESVQHSAQADWTVLVYMAADSHLDSFAIADLKEMASLGHSERLNLIALVDRSAAHGSEELHGVGVWSGAKLLKLGGGGAEELADWGEVNMGDPLTLRRFIVEGLAHHPALRHALVLWNHGAAWDGFGLDESAQSHMRLQDLRHGIASGLASARLDRFDLIGFDASLMGSVEVVYAMRGLADLMVASPERVPGHGWDYHGLATEIITSRGVLSPQLLAERIVNDFKQHAINHQSSRHAAMSAYDLSHASELGFGMDQLGWGLFESITTREQWRSFAASLNQNSRYGFDPSMDGLQMDLSEFIGAAMLVDGQAVGSGVGAAYWALGSTVFHLYTGQQLGLGGISVYLPESQQAFDSRYGNSDFGQLGGWLSFVQRHLAFAASEEHGVYPDHHYVESDAVGATFESSFSVSKLAAIRDLSLFRARYHHDLEEFLVYGTEPVPLTSAADVSVHWNYQLALLSDGSRSVPAPLFELPGAVTQSRETVMSRFEYRPPGGEQWIPVSLQLELTEPWFGGSAPEGKVLRAWLSQKHGHAEVKLEKYGQLRPVLPIVEDVETLRWRVLDDSELVLTMGDEPLTLSRERARQGDWAMGLMVRDWGMRWAMPYYEFPVDGLGGAPFGSPCPGGHGDCASGHCFDQTWDGEAYCTASCNSHSDCPAEWNSWCGEVEYVSGSHRVCQKKLPVDRPCSEHIQCESGACWTHVDWQYCVKSCISELDCDIGEICGELSGGVKACIWE